MNIDTNTVATYICIIFTNISWAKSKFFHNAKIKKLSYTTQHLELCILFVMYGLYFVIHNMKHPVSLISAYPGFFPIILATSEA